MSNYQNVKDFRIRQKKRIIYVMGEKCSLCGYNKCDSALELHHINPEEKDFTFAKNTNKAWDKIVNELPKTILVCANCHREIHANLIKKKLETSFIPQRAKQIEEEILLTKSGNKKVEKTCKYCGKIISYYATACPECSAIARRKIGRPTREELKNLIRTTPFIQIAKKYDVTDNAIRKWCYSMNLPSSVKEIKTYSDEDWRKI